MPTFRTLRTARRTRRTPTPYPSPQGGGEAAGFAARLALVLALLFAFALPAIADPTYPERTGPVVDAAHVLSDADKAALTRKVLDLEIATGVQLQIATVPSLDGQDIAPYSIGLARAWKIGQKGVDNGILLLWAPKERQIRFEIGRKLEGTFTDLQSKLIQRNTMVPKLKAGDGPGALMAGVDDVVQVLTKNKADLPERLRVDQSGLDVTTVFVTLFIFAFVLIFILSIVQQSRRRGRWGGSWGPGYIGGSSGGFSSGSSSGDSSSSGSSDSGGGDFSGGSGGDFGGGGSSDNY